MSRTAVAVLVVAVMVAGLGAAAYAPYHTQTAPQQSGSASAGFKGQARTAATHASFASDSASLSSVREHLGHALACIEGPRGKNVNPAWDNPCQGMGAGVLADLRGDPQGARWLLVVQAADDLAVAGLKAQNLDQAKAAARGVAELMKLVAQ